MKITRSPWRRRNSMPDDFTFRVLTGESWPEEVNEYVSIPLDSGIPGCRWHRIVLDADIPEDSALTIMFFTSETDGTPPEWSGELVFHGAKIAQPMDALIDAPPGRYIQLKITIDSAGGDKPAFRQAKIYYQRQSYLRYLPAIYQENRESRDFLERFLSIFESSMFDIEDQISSIPLFFDPEAAPEEFYRWLADWVSLDLYDLLEDRNREFILRAVEFYKQKGTASGLVSLVSFLTGQPCFIKEYMNNVFRSYGMHHYERDEPVLNECVENFENSRSTKFIHTTSMTLDTGNQDILANMGKYCDKVHYVIDTRESEGRYSPHVIGLFILLQPNSKLLVNKDELLKIINSFLPVFVRVEINIVDTYGEVYDTGWIIEEYGCFVHGYHNENIDAKGVYKDIVSWAVIHSYSYEYNQRDITNNTGYRTFHKKIGVEFSL
jgi:phage tail-like protein